MAVGLRAEPSGRIYRGTLGSKGKTGLSVDRRGGKHLQSHEPSLADIAQKRHERRIERDVRADSRFGGLRKALSIIGEYVNITTAEEAEEEDLEQRQEQ